MVVLSKMEKRDLKLVFSSQCLLFLACCLFSILWCVCLCVSIIPKMQLTSTPTKTLTIPQWAENLDLIGVHLCACAKQNHPVSAFEINCNQSL